MADPKNIIKALSDRAIAFAPIYRHITGSTTCALLLSQIVYWSKKKDKFYKTDEEIADETAMTLAEVRGAKARLKQMPFITITREGLPAKTWYRLDFGRLAEAIEGAHNKQTSLANNHQSSIADLPNLECANHADTTKITTKDYIQRVETPLPPKGGFASADASEPSVDEKKSGTQKSTRGAGGRAAMVARALDELGMDGESRALVEDWIEYRAKELGKPLKTAHGIKRMVNRLRELSGGSFGAAKRIIQQSKDHEWSDLYAIKANTAKHGTQPTVEERIERASRIVDAAYRSVEARRKGEWQ